MKKLLTIGFALAILAHVSCTKETGNGNDTGELSLNIEGIVLDVATRSGNTIPVTVDDLSVVITDAGGKEQAKYASASDMPESVKLPKGTYKVSAYYGSATSAGFDAYYIYGNKDFSIEPSTLTAVSLTCGIGNVQAAVYYGENIAAKYKDYYVDVWETTSSSEEVRFVKDEERVAFVPAGSVQLRVTLVKENGEKITSTPDPIDAAEATFLKLYLDIKDNTGDLSFKVTLSDDIEDIDVDIELPSFLLPPASPELGGDGFDSESSDYSFTEGVEVAGNLSIVLTAAAGIKSAVIVPSQELQDAGWPASFDLANLDIAGAIRSLGIDWDGDVAGATSSGIYFKGVVSLLRAAANAKKYAFMLEVTDRVGQTTGPRAYSFTVAPPQFGLVQPVNGNVWATKIDISGSMAAGNINRLKAEIKSGDSWTEYDISDISLYEGSWTGSVKGLSPATDYSIRLKYNSHYSDEFTFRTEDAAQVPNNDFETYCQYKLSSENYIDQYFWYASKDDTDKWWATRNTATACQTKGTQAGYTTLNSTRPVDNGKGGFAAELRTVAWGAGTTSAGGISNLYNVQTGLLYIGDYGFKTEVTRYWAVVWVYEEKLTEETITEGRPFNSRPAKFRFRYKYSPYNTDNFIAYAVVENNGVEIGRAEATGITANAQSEFTEISFDFVYTDPTLKATDIKVLFSSGADLGNSTNKDLVSLTSLGSGPHVGSVFTIDYFSFDYDFQ